MTDELSISQIFQRGLAARAALEEACSASTQQAAETIARALRAGHKVMFCGNGGSAGDSQHLAAEFVATLDHTKPRDGLAALALTTDSSFLTAYSNDFGFEGVFERQVQALGREGDVLVGLSTSGNSANVVRAVQAAKQKNIITIGMTGQKTATLHELCDVVIAAPSEVTMHIQECHIAIGHAMTAAVETLFVSDEK